MRSTRYIFIPYCKLSALVSRYEESEEALLIQLGINLVGWQDLPKLKSVSGYKLYHTEFNEELVKYLHVDVPHVQDAQTFIQSIYSANQVHIYCRRDQKLRLGNILQSNILQLTLAATTGDGNYRQYKAATARAVHQAHLTGQECHEGKLLASRAKQSHLIGLPAHEHSCYGIYTDQPYNLTLRQRRLDRERLGQFALGLTIWAAAPLLGESLACCYCTAGMLGLYLSGLSTVCVALLCTGSFQLQGLQPLGSNFKLVLEQQTTLVTMALVAGAWRMVTTCQRFCCLWRHRYVRIAHRRLMRFCAYVLIINAVNNTCLGCICLGLLAPWPELWWLLKWLLDQCIKYYRHVYPPSIRRLLNELEYSAQSTFETHCAVEKLRQRLRSIAPNWNQVASLENVQQFAQFLGGGDVEMDSRMDTSETQVLTEESDNSSLEQVIPTETLYHNLQFRTTSRSLQHEYGQN